MKENQRKSKKQSQAGFTLVEVAIVMVIIGLLIGAVLKGQAMIQNAKVKRVAKQADELRAAVMTFYDKYSAYPGDENSTVFPTGDTNNGNGDGQISALEAPMLFEDLQRAGIISGSFDGAGEDSIPNHVFGDKVRIIWVNPGQGVNHFIQFEELPWDVCLELDTKYDDGVFNTGDIRANEAYVVASGSIGLFYMPL